MHTLSIIFCVVLSAVFIACGTDSSISTDVSSQKAEYIETAEQKLSEIERLVSQDGFTGQRKVVDLPAGSVNGLQAAINEAGVNGIVNVKSGLHTEDMTVNVNFTVQIIGEEGAIIESSNPAMSSSLVVTPVIKIENSEHVHVKNIQFVSATESGEGNVGILVYNANYAHIKNNDFQGHQMAVSIDESDFTFVEDNTAKGLFSKGYGLFNSSVGIGAVGNTNSTIKNNYMTDFGTGFFASGNNGIYHGNTAEGGETGFFYCTGNSPVFGTLPDGSPIAASEPANNWISVSNLAKNTGVGHLVIDGVNNCKLINNSAENCALYDVEFVGPTLRFGTPEPLPTTFENLFIDDPSTDIEVKNCGVDNVIMGGQLVDVAADPCI
mgnify:CR=1 FL=1